MAANALAPFMYQLQESLNNFDLKQWVGQLDIKTGSLLVVVVVGILFLINLFAKPFIPFGRSLLSSAADAWDSRDLGLANTLRGR